MDLFQRKENSFRTRLRDLQTLIQYRNKIIAFIQETHLRQSHALNVRGYTVQPYDYPNGEWPVEGRLLL
jgi:hypothetical protein